MACLIFPGYKINPRGAFFSRAFSFSKFENFHHFFRVAGVLQPTRRGCRALAGLLGNEKIPSSFFSLGVGTIVLNYENG